MNPAAQLDAAMIPAHWLTCSPEDRANLTLTPKLKQICSCPNLPSVGTQKMEKGNFSRCLGMEQDTDIMERYLFTEPKFRQHDAKVIYHLVGFKGKIT